MSLPYMQLKALLTEQRKLDDHILNGRAYDSRIANNSRIALFVELGELMNELPSNFKHWKKTAKDNRAAALEEYADCLHFALSLVNYYHEPIDQRHDYDYLQTAQRFLERTHHPQTLLTLLRLSAFSEEPATQLHNLLKLGIRLGFRWDEIYTAYMNKNKVNHDRQNKGY